MPFTAAQKLDFERNYHAAIAADDNARLVMLKDNMLEIMVAANVARIKHMHAKSVVPHSKNRGGAKMQWKKIFQKGSAIVNVGVSLAECGPLKAVAFGVDKKTALAHIELCKTSVYYPNFTDPDIVEAGSVGCGHWNQFLAAIQDGIEVPMEFRKKLCEVGSTTLDAQRLARDQPALKTILEKGLQFTVIKASMEQEYPKLPHILQKALNTEHHIGEGLHVCACVCSMAMNKNIVNL